MKMELKHKTSPYTPQHNGLVMDEWDIDGEKQEYAWQSQFEE